MISRVASEIIRKGRDDIMARSVMFVPNSEIEQLENNGLDVNTFLSSLLDHLGEEGEARLDGLEAACSQFDGLDVPWKSVASIVNGLGRGLLAYLEERGSTELAPVYRGLIRAQSRLFEVYLDGERKSREESWKYQKEIDRFPDTIAATLDLATLIKEGLSRLKKLTGASEGWLFKLEPEGRLVYQAGQASVGEEELVLTGEAARLIIEEGEPYGDEASNACFCIKGLSPEMNRILLVPLVVRGRTTGAVLLSSENGSRPFGPGLMEIASSFGSRFAVAMENARLHSREQQKIKETVALLEIARAINSTLDLQEILDKMVQMTVDLCGIILCVVYLLDEERGRFVPGAYYGFIEDVLWEQERYAGFNAYSLGEEALAALETGEPVTLSIDRTPSLLPTDLMYEHGVSTLLMFPLSSRDRMTGIFSLFYPRRAEELEQEEIEVVRAIAAQASLAIENAALYEDIERSYFSTVKALAKAIEVKDPYTHGHSERVTEYALMIAEAMRLEERDRQKLKYAATLHDIGKIGIAGRVLNKPGSLTDEEYTHVKTHPLLGDSIVEPVEFLQGPRPIILHHHERFDGTGYPDGLKGRAIPLCARILAVADAFEAMRSDRPYRRALPFEMAKGELRKNSGGQFDPEIVEVFLDILERLPSDPVND
jgi:HD-GYP domain-containing protein (c-di-GMP phosphodiesterase class II)